MAESSSTLKGSDYLKSTPYETIRCSDPPYLMSLCFGWYSPRSGQTPDPGPKTDARRGIEVTPVDQAATFLLAPPRRSEVSGRSDSRPRLHPRPRVEILSACGLPPGLRPTDRWYRRPCYGLMQSESGRIAPRPLVSRDPAGHSLRLMMSANAMHSRDLFLIT